MNMRSPCDPYGGLNPLVDKLIGPKAYDIVRFVAYNMPLIAKVAAEPWVRLKAVGKTSGLVSNLMYPVSVTLDNLVDSTIWLIDATTGARYNAESGYFTTAYSSNGVTISINETAPVSLREADVMWLLTVEGVIINVPA